jgi:ATPase subunit of ABC transporter with duplicated ATPase domains
MMFRTFLAMPSVGDDVRFDHGAADELRRQLAATALAVAEAMAAVDAEAVLATADWVGAHSLDFDAERAGWSALAAELMASVELAVAAVTAAAAAAAVDQATRVALRERLAAVPSVVLVDPPAGGDPGG